MLFVGDDIVSVPNEIARDLKNLPIFMKQVEPHWSKHYLSSREAKRRLQGPRMLFVTLSAIRAVDVVR